ncbi:hypothetical protein D3C75_1248480 [compost metagenome]
MPLLTIVAPQGHSAIANPVAHPRYQFIDTSHTNPEHEILSVQDRLRKLWGEIEMSQAKI